MACTYNWEAANIYQSKFSSQSLVCKLCVIMIGPLKGITALTWRIVLIMNHNSYLFISVKENISFPMHLLFPYWNGDFEERQHQGHVVKSCIFSMQEGVLFCFLTQGELFLNLRKSYRILTFPLPRVVVKPAVNDFIQKGCWSSSLPESSPPPLQNSYSLLLYQG